MQINTNIVRCSYKPLLEENALLSQINSSELYFYTKSLEGIFYDYLISDDGFLCLQHFETDWISDINHPKGARMKLVLESSEKIKFTGEIIFYNNFKFKNKKEYLSFHASFNMGKLISIKNYG